MEIRIMDIMRHLIEEDKSKDIRLVNYIIKKYMDGPVMSRRSAEILPYLEINDREDFLNVIYNIGRQ